MIHIHNGDLLAEAARRSGLTGEHLPFREALATGPVPPKVDIETRAGFMMEMSREPLLRVRNDLIAQDQALEAAKNHDEIVLWFEHDLFCLANLIYLLGRFGNHRRLSLVWNARPLHDQDLPLLFASRGAVTPRMLTAAREAWKAYTSPDPLPLNRFATRETPDFPFLREGFALHNARFPSLHNGLGIVESRILTLVNAGAADFPSMFARFDPDPPRLGFGDAEVLRTLRVMAAGAAPLLTLHEEEGTPPKLRITITPAGEKVLAGEIDHLLVNDPDFWLGGVHLTKENVWRYDEERREIVRLPAAS